MTQLHETCISTPIGKLTLVADDRALVRIHFGASRKRDSNKVLTRTIKELEEYFAGKRKRFTLPLSFSGTSMQEKVWRALGEIPFGEKTFLRGHREARREAQGLSRRRRGKQQEPAPHRRALSSRDRYERKPDRFWRRIAGKTLALGARGRAPHSSGRTRSRFERNTTVK